MALTSPEVSGSEKRNLVGLVVDHITCRKDGAMVVFLSGLFAEETVYGMSVSCTVSNISASTQYRGNPEFATVWAIIR